MIIVYGNLWLCRCGCKGFFGLYGTKVLIAKLDRVVLLVADPPNANTTTALRTFVICWLLTGFFKILLVFLWSTYLFQDDLVSNIGEHICLYINILFSLSAEKSWVYEVCLGKPSMQKICFCLVKVEPPPCIFGILKELFFIT